MSDEVFNLSLHTMTIRLHSKEGDLVHMTPNLEFLLVDKLLRVITSDCFWLVSPKSDRVEDVCKNVPTFLARNYTHQTVVHVHDDEINCFLFVVFRSLVHDSVIKQSYVTGLLWFLSQVFDLLIPLRNFFNEEDSRFLPRVITLPLIRCFLTMCRQWWWNPACVIVFGFLVLRTLIRRCSCSVFSLSWCFGT